jgi:ankyrin repeat protein
MLRGDGGTALEIAVHYNRFEVVRFLIENGADINAHGGQYGSVLQSLLRKMATEQDGELVKFLLNHGVQINTKPGPDGGVLSAAILNDLGIEWIELLLARGADVNAIGGWYGTALQSAAHMGVLNIVELLLNSGADPNQTGGTYGSALHAAASSVFNAETMFKLLLDRGADINVVSPKWGSVLNAAASGESQELVRSILRQGIDMHRTGGTYGSVLHDGICGRGGKAMVELLLNHGANPNCEGLIFGSALEVAVTNGKAEIVRFLLSRGADLSFYGTPTGEGRSFFYDKNYSTYLQIAAIRGHLKIVKILVEQGMDVNAPGLERGNVLSAAVTGGKEEIVGYLIEQGATTDPETMAYCLEAAKGRKRMTSYLLGKMGKAL